MSRALVVLAVLPVALIAAQFSGASVEARIGVVSSIYNGDTLTLAGGQRVRLLQIDTPELGSGECYSRAARTALLSLLPVGSRVVLETDPALDQVDRYGRLLRYLIRSGLNVNVELVRRGAAAPYFYRGARGAYATALFSAAKEARSARRGLWGACPRTRLDPYGPIATGASGPPMQNRKCDPNYSGACVPPYPPDLDCADLRVSGSRCRSGWLAPTRTVSTETATEWAASSAQSGSTSMS